MIAVYNSKTTNLLIKGTICIKSEQFVGANETSLCPNIWRWRWHRSEKWVDNMRDRNVLSMPDDIPHTFETIWTRTRDNLIYSQIWESLVWVQLHNNCILFGPNTRHWVSTIYYHVCASLSLSQDQYWCTVNMGNPNTSVYKFVIMSCRVDKTDDDYEENILFGLPCISKESLVTRIWHIYACKLSFHADPVGSYSHAITGHSPIVAPQMQNTNLHQIIIKRLQQ